MGRFLDLFEDAISKIDTSTVKTEQNAAPPRAAERGYDSRVPSEEKFRRSGDLEADGINPQSVENNPYIDNVNKWWNEYLDNAMSSDPRLHFDENLARGTAATNVNRKSPEETLRLSRMADALNNTYYRSPQRVSNMSRVRGGGVAGSTDTDFGQLYRMPIETEEMRQMQRTRDYEASVRGREINRQQSAADFMSLEKNREEFELRLRNAEKFTDEQIREYMKLWDFQHGYFDLARQTAFMRANHIYTTTFDRLDVPSEQADRLKRIAGTDTPLANMLAVLYGISAGVPTQQQLAMGRYLDSLYDPSKDPRQNYIEINSEIMSMTVDQFAQLTGQTKADAQRALQQIKSGWSE